jgi:hypothetical protein
LDLEKKVNGGPVGAGEQVQKTKSGWGWLKFWGRSGDTRPNQDQSQHQNREAEEDEDEFGNGIGYSSFDSYDNSNSRSEKDEDDDESLVETTTDDDDDNDDGHGFGSTKGSSGDGGMDGESEEAYDSFEGEVESVVSESRKRGRKKGKKKNVLQSVQDKERLAREQNLPAPKFGGPVITAVVKKSPQKHTPTRPLSATTSTSVSKKKKSKAHPSLERESLFFKLSRYPLLVLFLLIILLDLILLFTVKFIVTFAESFAILIHPRLRRLKRLTTTASTFEDYEVAAKNLDEYLGLNEWKRDPQSDHFNASLIIKTTNRLRRLRKRLIQLQQEKQKLQKQFQQQQQQQQQQSSLAAIPTLQHQELVRLKSERETWSDLQQTLTYALKHNHAGCANSSLYSHTHWGTKHVIEKYYTEIEKTLPLVALLDSVSVSERKNVLKSMARNYGRTALCLSGGGGHAYYHLGVLKALFEQNLLPEVLTGASAGSLMAAMVCCRTDEEIIADGIFTKEVASKAFNMLADKWDVRFKRMREKGYLFDPVEGFDAVRFATKG